MGCFSVLHPGKNSRQSFGFHVAGWGYFVKRWDMDDSDWGARDISGFTLNHRIHIWTDNSGEFEGKIECRTIMNKILKAMTGSDLDLSGDGLKNVLPKYEGSRLLIEDKKGIISYHGIIELSYIIQIL